MNNVQAVIFDLNGVFITSPYLSDRFNQDFGVAKAEFLPALKEVMATVRLPEAVPVYGAWLPYFKQWGIELSENELHDYWFKAESENRAMVDLAKQLQNSGVQLFILSNNFRERAAYYNKHFTFLGELFKKIYYSWQTGFIKPDPQSYQLILKENNLDPATCYYFDDSEQNISAAKSLGITNSHIFKNADQVKEILSI